METRERLPRSNGLVMMPDALPEESERLLELMDDASAAAAEAEGFSAPAFDHGMRVFSQLSAHYQMRMARDMGRAHDGLARATYALKVATWWLAIVTVLLGVLELAKVFVD